MRSLTLKHSYIMDEVRRSILDTEFRLKDIVQFIVAVITATIFIVTINAKVDALTNSINELKDNSNKMSISNDLAIKALQNQVGTQSVQISLLQKDVDFLKSKK